MRATAPAAATSSTGRSHTAHSSAAARSEMPPQTNPAARPGRCASIRTAETSDSDAKTDSRPFELSTKWMILRSVNTSKLVLASDRFFRFRRRRGVALPSSPCGSSGSRRRSNVVSTRSPSRKANPSNAVPSKSNCPPTLFMLQTNLCVSLPLHSITPTPNVQADRVRVAHPRGLRGCCGCPARGRCGREVGRGL